MTLVTVPLFAVDTDKASWYNWIDDLSDPNPLEPCKTM